MISLFISLLIETQKSFFLALCAGEKMYINHYILYLIVFYGCHFTFVNLHGGMLSYYCDFHVTMVTENTQINMGTKLWICDHNIPIQFWTVLVVRALVTWPFCFCWLQQYSWFFFYLFSYNSLNFNVISLCFSKPIYWFVNLFMTQIRSKTVFSQVVITAKIYQNHSPSLKRVGALIRSFTVPLGLLMTLS